MTARREASTPPDLPGYQHVSLLGLGGFADVFLYRQELPQRDVAVKVLLAGSLDDGVRQRFQTEANLMAQLSHHPSIVTIYQASIAADGRPYLVMEYCSRPGLAERYRHERIPVAEALRIGVRLASAVETAHRAGILHRDIKPANVLTTDFGWPALTDFGIAATTQGEGATVGMSIPWSPPELLSDHPRGDERSDVYSLAATVYSLLAGRTPFEIPGGQNGAQQLVARVERAPLPSVGRDDVPPELFAVLDRAMAKHPARRYPSAAALGRALQQVEADLLLPVTPLDLPEDPEGPAPVAPPAPPPDAGAQDATRLRSLVAIEQVAPQDDATRLRAPVTIAPGGAAGTAGTAPAARARVTAPPLQVGAEPEPAVRAPVFEIPAEPVADEPAATSSGRARVVAGIASAVVVLGAVVAVAVVALQDDEPTAGPTDAAFTQEPGPAVEATVPTPRDLRGERAADGSVAFAWTNPDPQEGDAYLWGVVTATGEPDLALVSTTTVTVPAAESGDEVCVEVSIVRADRRSSAQPAEVCA